MRCERAKNRSESIRVTDQEARDFCAPFCELVGINTRRKRVLTLIRMCRAIIEDPIVIARRRMIAGSLGRRGVSFQEAVRMLTDFERRQVRERVLGAVRQS